MFSVNGLVFGIINIIGNFGTVFMDQVRCYNGCIIVDHHVRATGWVPLLQDLALRTRATY